MIQLLPLQKPFVSVLTRRHCFRSWDLYTDNYVYKKPLGLYFGVENITSFVLIDDSIEASLAYEKRNHILIKPFNGMHDDVALLYLTEILIKTAEKQDSDIRNVIDTILF